jgi:hypothetical protein
MAIREEIFADMQSAPAPAPVPMPTPELQKWDGKIFVRRVSSGVVRNFYKKFGGDDALDLSAAATVWFACDEAGNRIFNDDDLMAISANPAFCALNERIYAAACYINGLTEKNREGWRKNSASTAGNGSPSSSAAP